MSKEEPGAVLKFNGNEHKLSKVFVAAAQGPVINLKVDEISTDNETSLSGPVELYFASASKGLVDSIIFYKWKGKYTLLNGHKTVNDSIAAGAGTITGRLISGPALKQTRLLSITELVPPPKPAPAYSNEFANKPRVVSKSSTSTQIRQTGRSQFNNRSR